MAVGIREDMNGIGLSGDEVQSLNKWTKKKKGASVCDVNETKFL